MMKLFIILLSSLSFNLGCSNAQTEMKDKKINTDTLQRPAGMTQQAALLNFGSDDEPIMVWADYVGTFKNDGKEYSHIHGVHYHYVKADKSDTVYYENMDLRNGVRKFDFTNYSILNYPGEATIKVSNSKDSFLLFSVLESTEFDRIHRGIKFTNMPTIEKRNGALMHDVELEFNLKEIGNGIFEMTLNDGTKIKYRISSGCKVKKPLCSFLNRQDGKVYFVDADCYLELVNKDDVQKFQGLR
ncbi:MAG: hypothetical protein KF746_17880 [Chitinophagaceae bacterium]|nr:hypothetical protein [Chitinophagaceae bacterium]